MLTPDEELFQTLLDRVPAPLVLFDRERRYLYCNAAAIRNPEIRAWIIGHDDFEYCAYRGFDPELAHNRHRQFDEAERLRQTVIFEESFESSRGRVQHLRYLSPLVDDNGQVTAFWGYGLDITALRLAEERLQQLNQQLEARVRERTAELERATQRLRYETLHDALTGLPNRRLFAERLAALLREPAFGYAAGILDADHFKSVNDALGHQVGDELLQQLSRRLNAIMPRGGLLARLGGDEFGLLLPLNTPADAPQQAERLLSVLSRPLTVHGHELRVSGSLGLVLIGPEYQAADEPKQAASDVLRDADIALYRAKAVGRGGYQLFNPQMREEALNLIRTERDLRQALQSGELQVFYQPVIDLRSGLLRGFEALLRWQHPQRGLLTPDHFIRVAEDTGLILELDRWVLRAATQQLHAWTKESWPASTLYLSVNMSGRHFGRRNIIPELRALVSEFDLRPGQLNLELTESALMGQSQGIGKTLCQIRDLGVNLHLDDFGTGYSSLSYLQAYPLNTLKIDRSFVQHMVPGGRDAELVRTIITMSKNLRLEVTAEGIETEEQLELLRLLHCDFGQGYYFSPPLDGDAAYHFWTAQGQRD